MPDRFFHQTLTGQLLLSALSVPCRPFSWSSAHDASAFPPRLLPCPHVTLIQRCSILRVKMTGCRHPLCCYICTTAAPPCSARGPRKEAEPHCKLSAFHLLQEPAATPFCMWP